MSHFETRCRWFRNWLRSLHSVYTVEPRNDDLQRIMMWRTKTSHFDHHCDVNNLWRQSRVTSTGCTIRVAVLRRRAIASFSCFWTVFLFFCVCNGVMITLLIHWNQLIREAAKLKLLKQLLKDYIWSNSSCITKFIIPFTFFSIHFHLHWFRDFLLLMLWQLQFSQALEFNVLDTKRRAFQRIDTF